MVWILVAREDVSPVSSLDWPLLFHRVSHNPRTLMLYFLISLATWADLLASYRVFIFQVPILDFAFVEMRFVCKLASRGLSPACVIDSSEEEPP